jgi:hypothetical protein
MSFRYLGNVDIHLSTLRKFMYSLTFQRLTLLLTQVHYINITFQRLTLLLTQIQGLNCG